MFRARTWSALLLVCSMVFLMGARQVPLTDPQPIAVPAGLKVEQVSKALGEIGVLINNAGVYNDRGTCAPDDDACAGDWTTQNFGKMRYELLDTILAVNVKGPLLVSEARNSLCCWRALMLIKQLRRRNVCELFWRNRAFRKSVTSP